MKRLIFALAMLPGTTMAESLKFDEAEALLMCKKISVGDSLFSESPATFYDKCLNLMRIAYSGSNSLWLDYQGRDDAIITRGITICLTRLANDLSIIDANWIETLDCLSDIDKNFARWIVADYVKENLPEGADWRWMTANLSSCEKPELSIGDVHNCITRTIATRCSGPNKNPDFCPVQ